MSLQTGGISILEAIPHVQSSKSDLFLHLSGSKFQILQVKLYNGGFLKLIRTYLHLCALFWEVQEMFLRMKFYGCDKKNTKTNFKWFLKRLSVACCIMHNSMHNLVLEIKLLSKK